MESFRADLDGWHEADTQLRTDLLRRARVHHQRRSAEKAALRSIADFEIYRAQVRENFFHAIGGLPTEKTPLNARITGTIQRENYVIEKIIYESLPGFYVTAACYVPSDMLCKAAPIVFVHGHALNGKSWPAYQQVCIDLAVNGFLVLAIDPVSQGERFQYYLEGEVPTCTVEHTFAGPPFDLVGTNVAREFIWDVMRGVDYLETRTDVDISQLGITGSSGGGMQTCYLMMADPRFQAAVPCTFVSTLEVIMKTGMIQDSEQILFNCVAAGPDHDDFLTAIAPRPMLVGAAAYDFFPIEGTREAVRRAKEIYQLYGQPENLDLVVDDVKHSYSGVLRQACVNWFKVHLRGEAPDFVTTHPDTLEESALWATSSGQVLKDFPHAKNLSDIAGSLARGLPRSKPLPAHESRARLENALGISQAGDRSAPLYPRLLDEEIIDEEELAGAAFQKLWFFSAEDITVAGMMFRPAGSGTQPLPTTIVLLPEGSDEAGARSTLIADMLRENRGVFVFDARGIGGLKAHAPREKFQGTPFASLGDVHYRFSCDAMMLGLSLLGLRIFDVLRACDYLKTRDDVGEISLHGIGSGSFPAFFAAALEPCVAAVTVEEMIFSYRDLCETRFYDHSRFNLQVTPWGLLRVGDVVDFLTCLSPRRVTFVNPLRADGSVLGASDWKELFIGKATVGTLQSGWMPRLEIAP